MKQIIGKNIFKYGEVSSTNDLAKEKARQGIDEGAVIIAESQQSGRGKIGRAWSSPKGGLYLSVLLRPRMNPEQLIQFTLISAVPGLTPPTYRGLPDLLPTIVAIAGAAIIMDMIAVAIGWRSIADIALKGIVKKGGPSKRKAPVAA